MVKPSIVLAKVQVSDIGPKSLSTFFGGVTLGIGLTMEDFSGNRDLKIGVYGKRQIWDTSFAIQIKLVTVKFFTYTNY